MLRREDLPPLSEDDETEDDEATVHVHAPLFGRDVPVRLYTRYDDAGGVTDKMIACVNDVERLGPEHLPRVKELLFEHCTMCFEATSYGHVFAEEGEDETEATRRTFGIRTPDDAYAQAHFEYVAVDGENDRLKHRYAVLIFYPTWEDEHGCGIVLQDGVLAGWQSAEAYPVGYEADED